MQHEIIVMGEYPWEHRLNGIAKASHDSEDFADAIGLWDGLARDPEKAARAIAHRWKTGRRKPLAILIEISRCDVAARHQRNGRRALRGRVPVVSGGDIEMGWNFKKAFKDAGKKISRATSSVTSQLSRGVSDLGKGLSSAATGVLSTATQLAPMALQLAQSQAGQALLSQIPGIGPGVANAMGTYQAMQQGDPNAAQSFANVAAGMQAGDPRSMAAWGNIQQGAGLVNAFQQTQAPPPQLALANMLARGGGMAPGMPPGLPPQLMSMLPLLTQFR